MKILACWQKGVHYFWQSVNAILEEVYVVKTIADAKLLINISIFQYFKNYSSPTPVTRLKVVVNMVDQSYGKSLVLWRNAQLYNNAFTVQVPTLRLSSCW